MCDCEALLTLLDHANESRRGRLPNQDIGFGINAMIRTCVHPRIVAGFGSTQSFLVVFQRISELGCAREFLALLPTITSVLEQWATADSQSTFLLVFDERVVEVEQQRTSYPTRTYCPSRTHIMAVWDCQTATAAGATGFASVCASAASQRFPKH